MTGKQILDQTVEAWNRKDKEAFVAVGSPEITVTAPGGVELRGLGGLRQFYDLWFMACPNNVIRYYHVVSEGDHLIGEATFTGTHTGVLHSAAGDIPATGKRVSVDYVGALRFAGGKVTSMRYYFDVMDLMAQLGIVGAPAKA